MTLTPMLDTEQSFTPILVEPGSPEARLAIEDLLTRVRAATDPAVKRDLLGDVLALLPPARRP